MSRLKSKIPSPARSHGELCSPMQWKLRRTRSVCSTSSNKSVRLTEVITDSFQLSPLPKRQSVLTDDTNIEIRNRTGWWNKLGDNSKDVTSIMHEQDNEDIIAKNVAEEMDVDILSQEKENFTLDLPESSDNESIRSIVMPTHKLFTHKDNKPQKKFKNLEKNNETSTDLRKSYFAEDKEIDVRPKKLFNQVQKSKTKPVFNAELLSTSFKKTITKSAPNIKRPVQNIFGNRPEIQRKNIYADFIATDSEDEIPELQTKLFGFQMRTTQKHRSTRTSDLRSSTSTTADLEMDSWKHLPSSTMVDTDFDEVEILTPLRKARMSRLSKTTEINMPLNQHDSSGKLRRSNQSEKADGKSISKIIGDEVHNSLNDQNQSFDKSTKSNSMRNDSSRQKSLKELASEKVLQNISVDKTLVQEDDNQETEEMVHINSKEIQNISVDKTLIKENVNQETETMVDKNSKQMHNISIHSTLIQENVNQEKDTLVDKNSKHMQNISTHKTIIQENVDEERDTLVDKNSKQMQNISVQGNVNQVTNDIIDINSKQNDNEMDQAENKNSKENQGIEIVALENERAETTFQKEDQMIQEQMENVQGNQIMKNENNNRNNQIENERDRMPQVIVKEGQIMQSNQERIECDKEITIIPNEKEQMENNTENLDDEEIQNKSQSEREITEIDVNEIEEQDHESDIENEITIQEQLSENDEQNDSDQLNETTYEHEDERIDSEQELESHEDLSQQEGDMMECDQDNENISTEVYKNIVNEKSGFESEHATKSPEAVLHDKNVRNDSFTARGRNSSNRKSKTLLNPLNVSSAVADSVRYSDGSVNSSGEGSGWDSHRTLRKTFGKDFSPRKSLRNFVLQRSTKRQTSEVLGNKSKRRTEEKDVPNISRQRETNSPVSQYESYQDPEPLVREVDETVEESRQDNEALRRMQLENFMQRIKQKHAEEQRKVQAEVRSTLKSIAGNPYNPFKMPELPRGIRRITKNTIKKPTKPKQARNELVTEDMLPPEFLKDIKYKPPKRFQGANAPWITKRLYNFLEKKLEPKYDYKARVRAEKLVRTLYQFAKEVRPLNEAPQRAIDALKLEMARLNIVNTHYDFYNFFHEYMPREIRIRVNPDIMNKISVPRNVFGDIIQEQSLNQ